MVGKDYYYNRSKQEGYRSRSAYKLKQLDEATDLIGPGDTVIDLGAAPGGWLQVAVELKASRVIGVDRQRIKPLDGTRENETSKNNDSIPQVDYIRGDITNDETIDRLRELIDSADVVLSDMAPNMTGEYSLDHARSIHLAEQASAVALELLGSNGDFVVKVFDGPDLQAFRGDLEEEFDHVRSVRPDASRDSSSEVYLVAKHRLTAPVRPGEELEVEVVDQGAEGDGVAKVEGFTVFIPNTEPGETVTIRISEIKPRFGFAERVD